MPIEIEFVPSPIPIAIEYAPCTVCPAVFPIAIEDIPCLSSLRTCNNIKFAL